MLQEIQKLLEVVVERNSTREGLHRQRQNFEAWRQVSEVLLTACPEDLLSGERRQTVIFELLQELLCKVIAVPYEQIFFVFVFNSKWQHCSSEVGLWWWFL